MTPVKFSDYQNSTYNIGSPNFCVESSGENSKPSLSSKIATLKNSSGIKRPHSGQRSFLSPEAKTNKVAPPCPPQKMAPVDQALVNAIGKHMEGLLLPQMKTMITSAVDELKMDMAKDRETIACVVKSVGELEKNHASLSDAVSELEKKVSAPPPIDIESVTKAVMPELSKSVSHTFEAQWAESLKSEIREVECNLLIYGLNIDHLSSKPDVVKFFEETLKIPKDKLDSIRIESVRKLPSPKDPANKKRSVMVRLGHPSDRFICYASAKNLPRGISLDMSVPKRYSKKFVEFKDTAWKIRVSQENVSTRIDFNGPILTLKVKKKDVEGQKFSWTIYEEFMPRMVVNPPAANPPPARNPVDGPGFTPTPPLDTSVISRTVLFSKIVSNLTDTALRTEFSQLFNEAHGHLISEIRLVNTTTISVLCADLRAAQTIEKEYKSVKFQKSIMSVKLL